MRITIDTKVLDKEGISLGEYLMLLMSFYGINYKDAFYKAVRHELLSPDVFEEGSSVLSDNVASKVVRILMASDDVVQTSNIDYKDLAQKLQDIFPSGCKEGTSYPWKSSVDTVALKLMTLVFNHHFTFTEKEAIEATKMYVAAFNGDRKRMQLLKYFILKTYKDDAGEKDISSPFMTIIENIRTHRNHENCN